MQILYLCYIYYIYINIYLDISDINWWKLVHTEKYFLNFVKSDPNQIVFTIFRLIYNQMLFHSAPNQSEKCKYNLIWLDWPRIYDFSALYIVPRYLFIEWEWVSHREIFLNQTEIRLYLPFSDWFGTKQK